MASWKTVARSGYHDGGLVGYCESIVAFLKTRRACWAKECEGTNTRKYSIALCMGVVPANIDADEIGGAEAVACRRKGEVISSAVTVVFVPEQVGKLKMLSWDP